MKLEEYLNNFLDFYQEIIEKADNYSIIKDSNVIYSTICHGNFPEGSTTKYGDFPFDLFLIIGRINELSPMRQDLIYLIIINEDTDSVSIYIDKSIKNIIDMQDFFKYIFNIQELQELQELQNKIELKLINKNI